MPSFDATLTGAASFFRILLFQSILPSKSKQKAKLPPEPKSLSL